MEGGVKGLRLGGGGVFLLEGERSVSHYNGKDNCRTFPDL